jgi:GH43 family beta-xylosidase
VLLALLTVVSVLLTGVGGTAPASASAPAGTYLNPVIGVDAPDPTIIRDGNTYYAYATNSFIGNVPAWFSTDIANWFPVGDVLPHVGSWARPGFTWAPGVHRFGDQWVLYYTARHRASERQCIGRAVASSPRGPFVDSFGAPLVCQLDRGGSIDANVFADGSGAYLLWKSDDNAIGRNTHLWSQRLSGDGLSLVGSPALILSQDRPWEAPLIENPAMVHAAGAFWLFYSANWWESDRYATGYARCAGPMGPCTKVTTNGPWMSGTAAVAGPGGADFFTDTSGNHWIVYHAWEPRRVGYAAGGQRTMRVESVSFTPSGPGQVVPSTTRRQVFPPIVGATLAPSGYWAVTAEGRVGAFAGATHHGDMSAHRLNRPVVGMSATATGRGYWLIAGDGGVFAFGDAPFYGSTGNIRLNKPIVGMAPTPTGRGYWFVASDGGVFAYGDAGFHGSTGNIRLNEPIVGMAPTPTGQGYWLVASDGGIFAFGDARFFGSTGNIRLNQPIVGMAPTPTGRGYWMVASDGGVFSFGDATFRGAIPGTHWNTQPVVGFLPRGNSYVMINAAGEAFTF